MSDITPPEGYRLMEADEHIRIGDMFYGSDPPSDPPKFHNAGSIGFKPSDNVCGYVYFTKTDVSRIQDDLRDIGNSIFQEIECVSSEMSVQDFAQSVGNCLRSIVWAMESIVSEIDSRDKVK